jgi:SAM-dependent methyltransferase
MPESSAAFAISFPSDNLGADQDGECCEVLLDGMPRRLRFHDYAEIFSIPGLYEQLFYEELRCQSPTVVVGMLGECVSSAGEDPSRLRALDLGAGNGMVGEQLAELGATCLIGADILEEAATATERDRPDLYDDYLVADFTALDTETSEHLRSLELNCLTTVAALGFGDIPPLAFASAFDLIEPGGWIAISLKDEFLDAEGASGFANLIGRGIEKGAIEEQGRRTYRHRLSASGQPLDYVALVGRKRGDLLPLLD